MIDKVTSPKASLLRFWKVVTDLAGHAQWKPFIQLPGGAIPGGDAVYIFHINGPDKPVMGKAAITRSTTAGVCLRFYGLLDGHLKELIRRKLLGLVRSDACLERFSCPRRSSGSASAPRSRCTNARRCWWCSMRCGCSPTAIRQTKRHDGGLLSPTRMAAFVVTRHWPNEFERPPVVACCRKRNTASWDKYEPAGAEVALVLRCTRAAEVSVKVELWPE